MSSVAGCSQWPVSCCPPSYRLQPPADQHKHRGDTGPGAGASLNMAWLVAFLTKLSKLCRLLLECVELLIVGRCR